VAVTDRLLYCGVDTGASATKVAIIDAGKAVQGHGVQRSGIDFNQSAVDCLQRALEQAGASRQDIRRIVATGYGRYNVDFCDDRRTEIACHGRAAWFHCPREITVVDIGGQDSKVIHLDGRGHRKDFKMNRKCAAGTGAFLEEISLQLGVPLDRMNELALQAKEKVTLGSFCTVFTKTEILALARQGKKLEEILRGVYDSVAKRIIEMDPLEGEVVMTGGVIAYNSVVARLLEEKTGRKIFVPEMPQLAGAFGAALLALESA
jgi:predicted CoA-substrate-specific enzyme activase